MTKKEAILQAATQLFASKGYKGVAVSEIAARAIVAQGTVFHHFKSKENLLISICDELVRSYISGIKEAARGPGSGWDALERVLQFNQDFKKEHQDAITVVFRETRDLSRIEGEIQEHFCGLLNQVIEVKSQCIEKGKQDGSIRPVPAQVTAFLVHFLLVGKFHIETEGLLEVPDLDAELVEFCRRSLAADETSEAACHEHSGG
ncbi:MAG: TetR/AcrR family transcriptional regulator [bacterium]|nr:MAG: TetR/AcrR family transcriptional regulator [bacterium]